MTENFRLASPVSRWLLMWVVLISVLGFQTAPQADLILTNGHIITMDERAPTAEALAIGDGRILAVGTTAEIRKSYPNAKETDLGGKTVMPGIVEAHGHLLSLGESLLRLNVQGIDDPSEVVRRVAERVANTPKGVWIIGWGWDEGAWAKKYPNNEELSRVSPNNPVFLRGLHSFAGWANKKALEIAGITAATPNPPNGEILKDPTTGEPTGILTNRAQDLVTRHIPPMTSEQMEKALRLAAEECLKNGLTTVHDANISADMLAALRSLARKKQLKVRVYAMLQGTDAKLLEPFLQNGPALDPEHWLTIRSIKVFTDGALGSRGAALIEPYSDAPNTKGLVTTPENDLHRLTVRALRSGMQLAVHAIGDLGNRITLNAFARALKEVPSARDPRLRIEHAQVVAPEDIPRFAQLGVIASMQPPHCTSDMPWAENRVGPKRIKGAYAWRSILNTGARLCLSSDFPGETLNPFYGMYAAETRQTPDGKPEGGWYPEQRLTRKEVLRAYTIESAYAGFEDKLKGRIAPGMLADLIVLSENILNAPSKALLSMKVLKTYVGGKLAYSSDSAAR
jgi:hypothetical protein